MAAAMVLHTHNAPKFLPQELMSGFRILIAKSLFEAHALLTKTIQRLIKKIVNLRIDD
jgi:hypothetical protein